MNSLAASPLVKALERELLPLPSGSIVCYCNEIEPLLLQLLPSATTFLCFDKATSDFFKNAERTVVQEMPNGAAGIIICAGNSQPELNWLLAMASERVAATGTVVVSQCNDHGARRLTPTVENYLQQVEEYTKAHGRLVWGNPKPREQRPEVALDFYQVENSNLLALPGIFSFQEIDNGSKLLAQSITAKEYERVADFGCGYGFLSDSFFKAGASAREMELFDSDYRAVQCALKNKELCGWPTSVKIQWQDLLREAPSGKFDLILLNPPFHQGGAEQREIGQRMVVQAVRSLTPQGELLMVGNSHLGYLKLLSHELKVEVKSSAKGFEVYSAKRAST